MGVVGSPHRGRIKARNLPNAATAHASRVYQREAAIRRGLRRILEDQAVRVPFHRRGDQVEGEGFDSTRHRSNLCCRKSLHLKGYCRIVPNFTL